MPHTASAWKRMRKAEARRLRNRVVLKKLKQQLREFVGAVKANDLTKAAAEMNKAAGLFDSAGAKGYIHRNKASRLKSRMAARLARAKAAPPAPAKA